MAAKYVSSALPKGGGFSKSVLDTALEGLELDG